MTTEPLEVAPSCRHLLAIRGGSLACTLPAAHPGTDHEDGDHRDQHGQPARWSCSDPGTPRFVRVSVCQTFRGYLDEDPDDETG